ncbi:MAG: hypothetical protein JW934_02145 [Anaerolineae bacterium]|nr:hypothetical protein [Anaerolineae bacterium]
MTYQLYGLTSMAELIGDFVVYRNLVPADRRLPTVTDLGLTGSLPRKSEPDYGRVVAEILRRARTLDRPDAAIKELLFIGDTRLLDSTAFKNICAAGGWPGWCFIGRDTPSEAPQAQIEGQLYVANRWSALPGFVRFVQEQGFTLDAGTVVVIDMDKTLVGARGRNDKVIDEARVEGVQRTVADLLGPDFDLAAFQTSYDELNRPAYHPFTADNQDYLAYVCLILGAGLFDLDSVIQDVQSGQLKDFNDFIRRVQDRHLELVASGLTLVHDAVWACVQAGDPTPFKAFRYNEYLTTTARFGDLPGAHVDDVLKQRIVITQEVCETVLALREKGALLFALSDKPDEASMPRDTQAQEGMKALHHLQTSVVGES